MQTKKKTTKLWVRKKKKIQKHNWTATEGFQTTLTEDFVAVGQMFLQWRRNSSTLKNIIVSLLKVIDSPHFPTIPRVVGPCWFHMRLWSCPRKPGEKILILLEVLGRRCMRCGFSEEDSAESLHRSGCLAALRGLALWYNKCPYSFNSFSAAETPLTGGIWGYKYQLLEAVLLLGDGLTYLHSWK